MLSGTDGSLSGTPGSSFEQGEGEGSESSDTSTTTPSVVAATGFKMAALKPKKPIMGDLTQTGVDKWAEWTSERPKVNWTGFQKATLDYETPNQMCPIYDVKGYNHRKIGLSDKFNKTDMLIPFKKRVWTHLKDNGLDAITYLPDMRKEMMCVIYNHFRYIWRANSSTCTVFLCIHAPNSVRMDELLLLLAQ
jgi:hypothetical protein